MPLVTPSLNAHHPVRRPLTLSAAPGTVYGALRPDFPPLSAGDEHHPNSVVTPTTRSSRLGRRGCKTVKCSRPPPQRSHLYDSCAAHHTYNHRRKRPFHGKPVNAQGLAPAPVIGGASGSRRRRTPFGRKWRPIWVTDLQMRRVTEIRPVRESSRVRMMTRAPRRSHFGEQSLPLVILCSATGELCDPLACV